MKDLAAKLMIPHVSRIGPVVIGFSAVMAVSGLLANPLADHLWKNRLIVASVPDTRAGKEARKRAERAVKQRRAGMEDRDLVVIDVSPGAGIEKAVRLPEPQIESLRRRFSVPHDRAVFILIGKDGTAKARQTGSLDLKNFFALIDTMPMRKEEIRRKQRGD